MPLRECQRMCERHHDINALNWRAAGSMLQVDQVSEKTKQQPARDRDGDREGGPGPRVVVV
jgi:hypothetical protein